MQMLSSQGKPKRKQRTSYNLVTQEPDSPQANPPSSPLPSSITSLMSVRASLMSATTPNSNRNSNVPLAVTPDRQRPVPLPLPPAYESFGTNSPSRKPPPHESSVMTANSPLRTAPSFESFTARSPLRSNSAPSFEPAMTPSTPVRTATTYDTGFPAKSPLRTASMLSCEPAMTPNTPVRTVPTYDSRFPAKSPLRTASMPSYEPAITPNTPIRTAPTYDSGFPAKSPLRTASMTSYEPLISANSPLRMLPSYQRRIISPSASPMKQTHDGTKFEVESRHHTLGSFEPRPNQASTESRQNKDAESRISALAGLESIRSKNGAFPSMDLMQRSKIAVNSGSGTSQPSSARKPRESVPASPAAKREKENMRSTLREGRR